MSKRLALALTITCLATFTACMSDEDAAQVQFDKMLNDFGLSSDVSGGKGENFIMKAGDAMGQFGLCTILRNALGEKPEAQHLVLVQGETATIGKVHAGGGVGGELAIDMANYQAATFTIYQAGIHSQLFHAGLGTYRGLFWGKHNSVLDMQGFRASASLTWALPILRFLHFGVRGFAKFRDDGPPMFGGAFEAQLALKFGLKEIAKTFIPGLQLIPSFKAEGGYWRPTSENSVGSFMGMMTAGELVERDGDLGAELVTDCPGAHFVQYHGTENEEDGYHGQRGKAVAQAILRSGGVGGYLKDWDPGSAALARVAIGLGVARDHGGFGAVCGGGPAAGELEATPVPQTRCPNVPDVSQKTDDTETQTEELPDVTFAAPPNNATTTPNTKVAVKLEVSNENFKSVALFIGDSKVKEWTEAPFTAEIQLKTGAHQLKAIVMDSEGNLHEKAKIVVTAKASTVNNQSPSQTQQQQSWDQQQQSWQQQQQQQQQQQPTVHTQPQTLDDGCSLAPGATDNASLVLILLGLLLCARRRR
jgi:hypothetical protein